MSPSQLAVVTVTTNSSRVIEGWIDAHEATGRRSQMELCVVDSGSTPEERRLLRERVAPRVEVVCECHAEASWTSAKAAQTLSSCWGCRRKSCCWPTLRVLVWKQATMEIRWPSATRHRFDKSRTDRHSAGVALTQTAIEQTATDDRLRAS
jgi:hypothetical protein